MSQFERMIALIAGDSVPAYVPDSAVLQWGDRQITAIIKDHILAYTYRSYTIQRSTFERVWEAVRPDGSVVAYFKHPQDAPEAIDVDWEEMGGWPTLAMPEDERRGLIEAAVQAAYCVGMTWNEMRYYVLGLALTEEDWTFARSLYQAELYH